MDHQPLLWRWARTTWAGWVLGVPIIIAFALVGEAVGVGGIQVLVGAGMGTGVGLMQARIIRRIGPRPAPWILSSAIGLAVPFLVTDIATATGQDLGHSLYGSVAIGGLLAGAWQAVLLRPHVRRSGTWVIASALGWSLGGATTVVADASFRARVLPGIWGALAYLSLIALGGLVLGVVTGAWLTSMRRREPGADEVRTSP